MKKICYVTTISVTIEAFFVRQLQYLSEHGYEVSVICSWDEGLQNILGEKIRYIPVRIARGISPFSLKGTICALAKVFKEEKFDIVQYSTPNAAFCASVAAKISHIKIRNYHLMGLRYLGENGIKRSLLKLVEKITCRFSTHIECITKSNLDLCIKERLFDREKAVIVWNGSTGGVDLTRFDAKKREEWRSEVRKNLDLKTDDFVFGFVGRITRDKGVNELIAAFKEIEADCKLLIIGSKEGIDTLNRDLWEYALNDGNTVILDSVNDIEKYYAAMDVLLLPSYREGFGMVIAEAAAMGTPAIVSDIPGPIDVIEKDKTAFAVEARSAEALKERMKDFTENPKLSKQMSEECINRICEKFDSRILNEKIYERKNRLLAE